MHYLQDRLISSFRCSVASVEEPRLQQPCGMLASYLLTAWWKPCCRNAGPEAGCLQWPGELLPWAHSLPWLWQSDSDKKKTRCTYEVCIQVCVLLPFALTFCFLDVKGKWKGSTKRKRPEGESGERGTSVLNTIPSCRGWPSTLSVLPPTHRCAAAPQIQLWLPAAHYLRHNLSQWGELPREKGTH